MRHRRSPCVLTLAMVAIVALVAPRAVAQQLIWKQTGDNTATSGTHQNQDNFGFDVEAYDLDGDGVRDLCIGAPWYDSASRPTKIGAVYAALGPVDSTIAAQAILIGIGAEPWPDAGVTRDWAVGHTLVGIDNFFNDQSRLLLVGMPDYNHRWIEVQNGDTLTGVRQDAGRVALYRYNTSTDSLDLVTIVRDEGYVAGRHFGFSASRLGNFAGSSAPDFAVGAQQHGKAYVYLGGGAAPDTLGPAITYTYAGPSADLFGKGVAGNADLGGDSHTDLVITAERYSSSRGRVYVYFGTSSPGSDYDEGDANVTLTGDASTQFGVEVAVGDVTGDGDADLVVLADLNAPRLYVFAGPFSDSDSLTTASAAMELTGLNNITTGSHRALKADDDLTGDGIDDIVFGRYAPNDGGVAAEVIEGGPHLSGTLTMADLGSLGATIAPSVPSDSKLGHAVALGDVTGDGRADIVLGAPDELPSIDPNIDDPGFVYAYDYVHSVFRGDGAAAATAGLNYTGTPTAAIAFTYNDTVGTKHVFITLESSRASLYGAGNVSLTSGIASLANISSTGTAGGFVSEDDLPQEAMRGGAAADYDNDGYVDFYVAAPAGTDPDEGARLYRYQPSVKKFADVSDSVLVGSSSLKAAVQNGTAVSWADYDRDGLVDLALTHLDAQGGPLPPVLLRNRVSETGQFDDVSVQEGIDLGESDPGIVCWTHAWGDPDGDGDLDLFLGDSREREEDPSSRFYFNQRGFDPGFEDRLELVGSDTLGTVASATWVDLNQDAKLDLVLGMTYEQEVGLVFQNDGGLNFTGASFPASGRSRGAVPADLDYDGHTELISLPDTSANHLTVARVASAPGDALAFGDVSSAMGIMGAGPVAFALTEDLAGANSTRDGDVDLVLGKTVPGGGPVPADLFLKNLSSSDAQFVSGLSEVDRGPKFNWIGIVLKGGGGNNEAGIGARIECTHTDPALGQITQTAIVDGGSLRGSQRSQIIRFGLGTYSSTVSVEVKWPDGSVQTETRSANAIHVIEDSSEPGVPSAESFSYQPQVDGSVNLVFQWNTAHASKRQLSGVEVRSDSLAAPECYLADEFVNGAGPGLVYTMAPVYNAQGLAHYHHTLTWNRECTPSCVYNWKAIVQTDSMDDPQISESWKRARVSLCAQ